MLWQCVRYYRIFNLGVHAQRGLLYLVCVSVCVCVSVTRHLTTRVIICTTNEQQ